MWPNRRWIRLPFPTVRWWAALTCSAAMLLMTSCSSPTIDLRCPDMVATAVPFTPDITVYDAYSGPDVTDMAEYNWQVRRLCGAALCDHQFTLDGEHTATPTITLNANDQYHIRVEAKVYNQWVTAECTITAVDGMNMR